MLEGLDKLGRTTLIGTTMNSNKVITYFIIDSFQNFWVWPGEYIRLRSLYSWWSHEEHV
jgi:hypothetical protein